MIRMNRPPGIPAVLAGHGTAATRRLCAAYEAAAAAYGSGEATFTFDPGIYGADEVKSALRAAQHDKCCFCDSKVTHISYGDVEHFRPKAACRQRPDGPLLRPGYYWLAYEWKNLFFCCQLCNQRFKENLFPLRKPRARCRSQHDTLPAEEPLFVSPEEDPSRHLRFRAEYLHAFRRSRRGQATIDALGLNRSELAERRRDHWAVVQKLIECRQLFADAVRQAQAAGEDSPARYREQVAKLDAQLAQMSSDSAEYAAMTRAAQEQPGGPERRRAPGGH
jgi:uncharacterized protein (TIGR02646 family)